MSKKLTLSAAVVAATLAAGVADKAKAEKSPTDLDLGAKAKVENVISADPRSESRAGQKTPDSAINYEEAQDQLAQKEQGDGLEAERQKVREFFYKTIIEYSKEGFKTDSIGKLWKKLAPYFSEPSNVQVDYGVGIDNYSSEYFFRSVFPKHFKSGYMKGIAITKEDLDFEFEPGSDKIELLGLDLFNSY